MYFPKFTISNEILKNIGVIEACREVIANAPLIPAYEKRFREEAVIRTVHHGTHIEGNDLSFEQAKKVIQKAPSETDAVMALAKTGITARERDVQEVINYREVMEWLEKEWNSSVKDSQEFIYSEAQIKKIHRFLVNRLIHEENQGVYRQTQVVLRDSQTGEITFRPPPAVEVPYLVEDLVNWLNSKDSRVNHPVIRSAIAHYALAAVHPFVDGNGRTARAFATLILFVEGYDIKRLFSLEEYFDRDAQSYYKVLVETSNQSKDFPSRDLTPWTEYFTKGLSVELTRIKDRIRKVSVDSKIRRRQGAQLALSERQMKVVEFLAENSLGVMSQLKNLFPMVSEDTVLRDLQELTKEGIIKKRGITKGAHYELVT